MNNTFQSNQEKTINSQDTTLLQENLELQKSLKQTIKNNIDLKLEMSKNPDTQQYDQYRLDKQDDISNNLEKIPEQQKTNFKDLANEKLFQVKRKTNVNNQIDIQKLQSRTLEEQVQDLTQENTQIKKQLNLRQISNPYDTSERGDLEFSVNNMRDQVKKAQSQNNFYQNKMDQYQQDEKSHDIFQDIQRNILLEKQQIIIQLELKIQQLESVNKKTIQELVILRSQVVKKKVNKKGEKVIPRYLANNDPQESLKQYQQLKIQFDSQAIQLSSANAIIENLQAQHQDESRKIKFYSQENDFLRFNLSIRLNKIHNLEKELSEFGLKSHQNLQYQINKVKNRGIQEFKREKIKNHTLEQFLKDELKVKERQQIEISLKTDQIDQTNKELLKENIHLKQLLSLLSQKKQEWSVDTKDDYVKCILKMEQNALYYKELYQKEYDVGILYRQNIAELEKDYQSLEQSLIEVNKKLNFTSGIDFSSEQKLDADFTVSDLEQLQIRKLTDDIKTQQKKFDIELKNEQMKNVQLTYENIAINKELSKKLNNTQQKSQINNPVIQQAYCNQIVENLEYDNQLLREKLSEYITTADNNKNFLYNRLQEIKQQESLMNQQKQETNNKMNFVRSDLQKFVNQLLDMDHKNQILRQENFQLLQNQAKQDEDDIKPKKDDLSGISKNISDWTFKLMKHGGYFEQ